MNHNPFLWIGRFALVVCCISIQAAAPPVSPADLDRSFTQLLTYTWSQSREPLNAIEKAILTSANDPAARKQLENRLVSVLRTGAPFPAKQYVCRKLSQIGTADSIPALAPLLLDPALSHPARLALERIPDPRAMEALRRALPQAEGSVKVGIMSSLGVLKDAAAVSLLTNLLADADAGVAAAAASALGHIATVDAARALGSFRSTGPMPTAVAQAWLLAATRLAESGHRAEAANIFRQLYSPEQTAPVRLAAFKGLVAAEPERAIELLSRAVAGDDDQERSLAAHILADDPAAANAQRFVGSFPTYSPTAQVVLLEAFRFRRESAARPAALAAAESTDPRLRVAGLRALATLGTAADVPMLARRAAGNDEEASIVRAALASLLGENVNAAIVAALPGRPPEVTVELLNALTVRGAVEASQSVAARLTDASEPVRTAAMKSLAVLGGREQVAAVVASLKTAANDSDRATAQSTLTEIAERLGIACVDAILQGLKGAKIESRLALLHALGVAGGSQALEAVRASLTHEDPRVRTAAFQVLTDWPSLDAAPVLLGVVQNSAMPDRRAMAFRGYLRLCADADGPAADRMRWLNDAMKAAGNTDEKRLVIAALGEQRGVETLKILSPCFADPALAQETCLATVKIAANAEPKNKNDIVPCLKQVIKISTSHDVREHARSILERLGAKPD